LKAPTTTANSPPSSSNLKPLLADGYHPIVFCRYIPTGRNTSPSTSKGKLGRKTGRTGPSPEAFPPQATAANASKDSPPKRATIRPHDAF